MKTILKAFACVVVMIIVCMVMNTCLDIAPTFDEIINRMRILLEAT